MKIIFETTMEQFKKVYLSWITSHVSTENIYSVTTDDITITASNNDTEVTIDKIVVTCNVPESVEESTDTNENNENEGNEENNEPSQPEGEGGE